MSEESWCRGAWDGTRAPVLEPTGDAPGKHCFFSERRRNCTCASKPVPRTHPGSQPREKSRGPNRAQVLLLEAALWDTDFKLVIKEQETQRDALAQETQKEKPAPGRES